MADLLRIFFDQKDLSDFDINTIMNMKSKQFIYGTSHQKRENVNTARSWMNDDEDDIEGKVVMKAGGDILSCEISTGEFRLQASRL